MKIVMIGSGNVATILALKFCSAGHNIIQVYSKTKANADCLANKLNTDAVTDFDNISKDADLYVLAISDNEVSNFAEKLLLHNNAIVVHTAGAVSIKALTKCSNNYGVLYPIQSIRKNMSLNTPIPFAIDGNNKNTLDALQLLISDINQTTIHYNDEQRLKLHIAAVIASNFVNYLYNESASFCNNQQLKFSLLQPLIEETALRLRTHHPQEVFTGPAVRKDFTTINKHIEILQNSPELLELYQFFTNRVLNKF